MCVLPAQFYLNVYLNCKQAKIVTLKSGQKNDFMHVSLTVNYHATYFEFTF